MKMRLALIASLSCLVLACTKNPLEVTISSCPAVAVVGDLGSVTRFAGEGRTASDIAYTASVNDVRITCTEEENVVSYVTFDLVGRAGPALSGGSQSLSYFVAVMKDNNVVITKSIYDVALRFAPDGSIMVPKQAIQNVIPSLSQAQKYDYEILIGLQITPEEAAYNVAR